MGHKLVTSGHQGNANTIVVDADGRIHGVKRSPAIDLKVLRRLIPGGPFIVALIVRKADF